MKRLPKLDAVTNYVSGAYRGMRDTMPPSGVAYVVGLIHGMFDDADAEMHLRAIDSLCRIQPPGRRGLSIVYDYLLSQGIADYRAREGVVRTPENP